ncbi:YqiA/YcfP family alpha/beta fold hydrolase [Acinetobacter sp. MB5]|uniref:YqiA/YcfP family alpha/beta fold hydrolase n=1 Tax=Acinetobacter sp. MB5 TaxID=2069438 RepID=UPI000DD0C4F2|nr:YqiA/YcfP family alpha/beta fold hydrolase [Acinetobacter sp. MB5]
MNIIYLHGFRSHSYSIKGQQLKQYCLQHCPDHHVYLPDLNKPPLEVLAQVARDIQSLEDVALVGSSFGGFYATHLALQHKCPAVLINPAVHPYALFMRLFGHGQIPLQVTPDWALDEPQLQQLATMDVPIAQDASKLLVLLQQGDEVLDYREAQRYYNQAQTPSMIMTEVGGNHAMENFADKIPMLLTFLALAITKEK